MSIFQGWKIKKTPVHESNITGRMRFAIKEPPGFVEDLCSCKMTPSASGKLWAILGIGRNFWVGLGADQKKKSVKRISWVSSGTGVLFTVLTDFFRVLISI